MRQIVSLILVLLLALTSCRSSMTDIESKIGFHSIESVSGTPFDVLTLGVSVMNQTGYTINVEEATVTLRNVDGSIATSSLVEPFTIMKGDPVSVKCSLKFGLSDPIALLSLIPQIRSGRTEGYYVDLGVTVSISGIRKHIERNNVPLERFTSTLGKK